MCTVSMIGDFYSDKWRKLEPYIPPYNPFEKPLPNSLPLSSSSITISTITREEFDKLKKEVEDMKELLIRAKEYDEKNNEPHCEMEDKVKLLKEVAKLVGVSLEDIFKT